MIYDASTWSTPQTLQADLCVVGAGAGGAMAAMVAAQAGLRVILLEAGPFIAPEYMSQREEEMLPQLLWAHGGRATEDRAVRIHQGRGVGGSTLHNLNLCRRIPEPILREWERTRSLSQLDAARWRDLYAQVELLLEVSAVPETQWNRHNQLLREGAAALGWRHGGLSHNRSGCIGSGFCEVGCAYDAKNNAAKVLIPRFIAAGGIVVSRCEAARVVHDDGVVSGVEAYATHVVTRERTSRVRVDAARVCVSASATGTAALLLRSGLPDESALTGQTLRIHPALVAAGDFEQPVTAWRGIPQTVECTEFLDFEAAHGEVVGAAPLGTRTWIVPAFAHPMGVATMLPGHGESHAALMRRYAHLGVLTPVLHDFSRGTVAPKGDRGMAIRYWPDEADRRELMFGLARSAELLLAAGARRVLIPGSEVLEVRTSAEAAALAERPLNAGDMDITAVHPMGTAPMSDDPALGPVDSAGKHHGVEGLWVADGSLFPTSIGGPPQLSIYALGVHIGEAIARSG
jgi:choline dehydrogenase-like flavoprotein